MILNWDEETYYTQILISETNQESFEVRERERNKIKTEQVA